MNSIPDESLDDGADAPATGENPDKDDTGIRFSDPVLIRSVMLTGIFILLLFYTLYFAAPVLMPITLAILLSIVLSPIVRWLTRVHIPRPLGTALVLTMFIGCTALAFYLLADPAARWLAEIPSTVYEIQLKIQKLQTPIQEMKKAAEQVEKIANMGAETTGKEVVEVSRPGLMQIFLSETPQFFAGVAVIIIFLYFLLASGDSLLRKLVNHMPGLGEKKRAVQIVRDIQRDVSSYLFTITLINLGLGACVAGVLYLLELPNALLWGAMVAALNFAPYIGPAISLAVLTFVAILTFDTLSQTLLVSVSFLILTTLEGQFITPIVVGNRLALSPVIIFLGIIIWGWMWGIIGALIAIPLLVCFKLICERIDRLSSLAEFIGR